MGEDLPLRVGGSPRRVLPKALVYIHCMKRHMTFPSLALLVFLVVESLAQTGGPRFTKYPGIGERLVHISNTSTAPNVHNKRVQTLREQEPKAPDHRPVLDALPDNVLNAELQVLGGKTLRLADYSGKVLVINLWATWCSPCRMESPDLAKLYKEFKDRGVVVIELSTENAEASKEAVREWVWNFRLPYIVGWATPEVALTLMQGREAIPQAFVIGRDGRLLKRFIGYNSTQTFGQMKNAIEEALEIYQGVPNHR